MLEHLGRISITHQRLLLLVGCAVLFALWTSWVPLTEQDETRYAEATREMITGGDYLMPHFNYAPRYKKPVLYYWLQAPSIQLFGVNEVAARLPSAVVSLGVVLLVHSFLLFWLPQIGTAAGFAVRARGAAFLGALALMTMPMLAIWSRTSTTDPSLTLFLTAGFLALLQAELLRATGGAKPERWYLIAAAAMGLAFLTKGPVAVVLPVLVWVSYHLLQHSLAREARQVPWLAAIGLFLLIAIPWYVITYFVDGPGFLKAFFLEENVQRFTSTMENHGGRNLLGLLYYWPLALLLLFPYSGFLLRDFFQPFGGHPSLGTVDLAIRLRRFALCWLIGIIAFFSIAKTQLPSYIQGIAAAAAILFSLHALGRVSPYAATPATRRARAGAVVEMIALPLLALIWIALPTALIWAAGPAHARLETFFNTTIEGPMGIILAAQPPVVLLTGLLALPLLGFAVVLIVPKLRRSSAVLLGGMMLAWTGVLLTLVLGVAPLVIRSAFGPTALLGRVLRAQPADAVAIAFKEGSDGEALVYYGQRQVRYLNPGDPEAVKSLMALLDARKTLVLVTTPDGESVARPLGRTTLLNQVGSYRVLRLEPFVTATP